MRQSPRSSGPPRPALIVHLASGTKSTLTLTAPGAGTLTISGTGLTAVHRSVRAAGSVRITVTLTKREKRLLGRRHRLKLQAHITFKPAAGDTVTKTVTVSYAAPKH